MTRWVQKTLLLLFHGAGHATPNAPGSGGAPYPGGRGDWLDWTSYGAEQLSGTSTPTQSSETRHKGAGHLPELVLTGTCRVSWEVRTWQRAYDSPGQTTDRVAGATMFTLQAHVLTLVHTAEALEAERQVLGDSDWYVWSPALDAALLLLL